MLPHQRWRWAAPALLGLTASLASCADYWDGGTTKDKLAKTVRQLKDAEATAARRLVQVQALQEENTRLRAQLVAGAPATPVPATAPAKP